MFMSEENEVVVGDEVAADSVVVEGDDVVEDVIVENVAEDTPTAE